MRDLYERVVEDPAIKELILKAQGFKYDSLKKPVVVMDCPGTNSEGKLIVHPSIIYSSKKEYAEMFTDSVRAGFKRRTIAYEVGSRRFLCLTDIVDNADEKKNGQWVVIEKTKDDDYVAKEFEKEEDLDKQLPDILTKTEGYTLVHKYGTKDYLLIEEKATVRMEKNTASAKEFLATVEQSEPLKPYGSEIEITEPPVLDLREEELKQKKG